MPALMGAPDLLVLDEPTSGLDPIAQHQVHEVMRDAAAAGRTVLLSSHVHSEVGRVADRVGLIRSGRLLTVERIAELRARSAHLVDARVAGPLDARDFADVPGVVRRTVADGAFHHEVTGSLGPVVRELARRDLLDLSVREPDLDALFLAFYAAADDGQVPAGSRLGGRPRRPVGLRPDRRRAARRAPHRRRGARRRRGGLRPPRPGDVSAAAERFGTGLRPARGLGRAVGHNGP